MLHTLPRRYLWALFWYPFVYLATILLVRTFHITGFVVEQKTPDFAIYIALIPVLYNMFGLRIASRFMRRHSAIVISLVLSTLPTMIAMSQTGGYGSPHVIALAVLVFLSAMLGPWVVGVTLFIHFVGFIMSLLGSTYQPRMEFAPYALGAYTVAGLVGWLVFHRYYVREDPQVDYIRQTLRNEQLRSEALIAAMNEGIIMLSPRGRIQLYNKAAAEIVGVDQKELIGKDILTELATLITEVRSGRERNISRIIRSAIEHRRTRRIDLLTLVRPDSTSVDLSGAIMPIRDEDGEIGAFMIVIHDVTSLMDIQRLKDDFINTASHELRTPLSVIAGYADLLANPSFGDLNDKQLHYVKRTKATARRLVSMVNDMLDITKLESDKREFKPEEVSLKPFVNTFVNDLEPLLKKHRHTLSVTHLPKSPTISIDKLALRQVLTNLLANAITYTPDEGSLQIVFKTKKDAIECSIIDTGPGIPAKSQKYIFEKFNRLPGATSVTEGTGLGLAIARELVVTWGGKLDVESDGKTGSRFYFTIPNRHIVAKKGEK